MIDFARFTMDSRLSAVRLILSLSKGRNDELGVFTRCRAVVRECFGYGRALGRIQHDTTPTVEAYRSVSRKFRGFGLRKRRLPR
ncbi:MAG: hypothetical protein EAZ43_03980 [Betaproteobacteria bacterium]|nr:MAG: hypothetical protein EAZ43_03980 [Betaproteobacteria bacterium]